MTSATSTELEEFGLFIGGKTVDALSGKTFESQNPYTGAPWARLADGSPEDVDHAVAAARAAFEGEWGQMSGFQRAAIMRSCGDAILANAERLAQLEVNDSGKLMREMLGQLKGLPQWYWYFSGLADKLEGRTVPPVNQNYFAYTTREPVGVVGAITPWNFPNAMVTRKLAPALAAGCTIVIKPASATPYSALAIALLCEMAGIPAGVVNVVTGSAGAIGGELTANPKVHKITFTGSTEIGIQLLRESAETVKKCSMELGGNAPFLVFDDADVDAAIEGAMISKFRNGGQTCVCTNRFYVQDGVYDEFVGKLTARVKAMKVGYGMNEDTDIGAMIDEKAVEKVEEHIADALAGGARLLAGGQRNALGGTFFNPTVVADVKVDMKLAREETFGPLAGVIRFSEEAEAIAMANDSEFGLASYFYSRDLSRVWRVAEALEAGMVGINTGLISTEVAPFGGVKQSGLGREGSKYGLEDFMEVKYLCMGI
jgi:succinate-semialdehyde dehydrogenase/glutarate-semialdehyde dehydrogenase